MSVQPQRVCPRCGAAHSRSQSYCASCHAAYMRRWRPSHPLTAEQRVKMNARSYANVYQRRGRIRPKPCQQCGALKAQKHHPDYTRPLHVVWLCRACHLSLHVSHVEH